MGVGVFSQVTSDRTRGNGGVQKTCRCGTSGHGLVGMELLGRWLDFMVLEVFSNLWFYDSMILWLNPKKLYFYSKVS